jgi:hypothetical protein
MEKEMLKETLKEAMRESQHEQALTFSEAFQEFFDATRRLNSLGEKAIHLSHVLESGKKINPRTLKKLGGSIKWWQRQCFLWGNACITLSRR